MTTEISNPLTGAGLSTVCEGNLSVKSKRNISDGWPTRYFRYETGSGVLAQWASKTGSQIGPRARVTRVEDIPDRPRKKKNRFDMFVTPVDDGSKCPPAVSVAASSASEKQRWLAALANAPGGLSRVSAASEVSSAYSSPDQSPIDHIRRLSGASMGASNAPAVLSPNSSASLSVQVSELEKNLLGADGVSAPAGKGLVQRIEELELAMHGEVQRSLGSLHLRVQQLHSLLFQGDPAPAPMDNGTFGQVRQTAAPSAGALAVQKRVVTLDDNDDVDVGAQKSGRKRSQSGGLFAKKGKAVVHNSNKKVVDTPLHARDESHPCHQLLYAMRWLQANPDYWALTLFSIVFMIMVVFCYAGGFFGGQVDGVNRFLTLGLTMAWAAAYAPYKVWCLSFPHADQETRSRSKKCFHVQFACLALAMFFYYGLNAPTAFLWGFFAPACSQNQYADAISGSCMQCPQGALTSAGECCGSALLNIENTIFFPNRTRYKKNSGCVSIYDEDEVRQVHTWGYTIPLGASALDYRTLYCKWDDATNTTGKCTVDKRYSDGGTDSSYLESRCSSSVSREACVVREFRDFQHKFVEDQACKLSQGDRWYAVKAAFHRWYGPEARVDVCAAINRSNWPVELQNLGLDDKEIVEQQGKQPSAMGRVLMAAFIMFSIVLFVYDSAVLPYIYRKYWINVEQSYLWWPVAFGLTMCSILWYNYTLVFFGLDNTEKSDASGLHIPNHNETFRSRVFDALFILLAIAAVKIVFIDTFQTWSSGKTKQSDIFCILCFTYFTYWMSYMCADTILKLQEWAGQDQFLVVISLCAFSAMMLVLFVLSRIAASRCFDYQRVPTVMFYMFFMADMLQELMMSDLQVDQWQFWVVMLFDLWLLIMRDADMWEDVSDYLQDKLGPIAGTCVTIMQLVTGRGDDAAESITNRVVGPLQHRIRAMTVKAPANPEGISGARKLNRAVESDADIASAEIAIDDGDDNTTSSSGSDEGDLRRTDKKTWGAMERKAHRIVGASECALSEIVSSVTLFTWVMAEDLLEAPRLTFGFCTKQRDNGKIVYATVLVLQLFGLYCSHKIILWKARNEKAKMLKKENAEKSLPLNKSFHFFLSHKKTHSRHGSASESLALSIKDALTARGFTGFVDIDSLRTISNEALAEHVNESCCVVLILNDETLGSEWVRHEIKQAEDANIPIITVIDQDLYNKQATIDYAMSQNFTTVLNHQVIGYTKQSRESAHDLIVDQIVEASLAVRRGRLEALTKHLQTQTIWTPNMSSDAKFSWGEMCKRMCSEERMLPYKIMTVILVSISLSFTNAFVKIDLIQALDRGLTVPICEDNIQRWHSIAPCMTQLCGILKRAELGIVDDYPTVSEFRNKSYMSSSFRPHVMARPTGRNMQYAFWKLADTSDEKMPAVQAQSCYALQDSDAVSKCLNASSNQLSYFFNASAAVFYCAQCHLPNQLDVTKTALEAPPRRANARHEDYENRCQAKNRIEDLYPCVFGDEIEKMCNCCPGALDHGDCHGSSQPRTFARCESKDPVCDYTSTTTLNKFGTNTDSTQTIATQTADPSRRQ